MTEDDIQVAAFLSAFALVYLSVGAITSWLVGFEQWSFWWIACAVAWPLVVGIPLAAFGFLLAASLPFLVSVFVAAIERYERS